MPAEPDKSAEDSANEQDPVETVEEDSDGVKAVEEVTVEDEDESGKDGSIESSAISGSPDVTASVTAEDKQPDAITGNERNSLFEQAESYLSKNKLDMALECYLKCVKGIEQGSGFLYLPQCLHKIAECYHRKDEDERAIQFLKAEKMYYETALIDTKQMKDKIEEISANDPQTEDDMEAEVVRAVEYENLARLCLDKHQSQLALEFSGKATKLYQKNYGDDHVTTQRCLDLFTSVYAQVGKEEYTDKLTRYESEPSPPDQEVGGEEKTRVRKRRQPDKQISDVKENVTTDSPTTQPTEPGEEEDMSCCCLSLLWIALILCAIAATIMFSVVYCKVTPTSWTCHWVRVQYRSLAEDIGFIAYKLGKKG